MTDALSELTENFALFEDWEDRYRYLIDLGRALPPMADTDKTEQNLVRGCTARVWMVVHVRDDGRFGFAADSDAHIVRGLIALLDRVYNGCRISDIPAIDINRTFKDIGLDRYLSPNRRSGFFAMVERIKTLAKT